MTRLFLRFLYHVLSGRTLPAIIVGFLLVSIPAQAGELKQLTINSGNQQHHFSVEVMRKPEERARGLMFVKRMDSDRGMLFDFGEHVTARMWMKNTFIPLDMIFAKENGVITNIAKNTTPHSEVVLSSVGKVRYVLEINAGLSTKMNIRPGDRMDIPE